MQDEYAHKIQQDEVLHLLDTWTESKILMFYQAAHARGITITNIDFGIEKAWKKEHPKV